MLVPQSFGNAWFGMLCFVTLRLWSTISPLECLYVYSEGFFLIKGVTAPVTHMQYIRIALDAVTQGRM
jgi:hypothetical protein